MKNELTGQTTGTKYEQIINFFDGPERGVTMGVKKYRISDVMRGKSDFFDFITLCDRK